MLIRLFTLLCVLVTSVTMACSVPVFRYGLEHWAADAYQVMVFHEGTLEASKAALLKKLKEARNVNLNVADIDLKSATPEQQQVWEETKAELVIKAPPSAPLKSVLWSGALTEQNIALVLDSPVRAELTQRLGDGDSAIWILLESGDKAADDVAAKSLEKYLEHVGETLSLPQLDDADIKNGLVSVPADGLRLTFPMLRVSRTDAKESFFVACLLASEPDLRALKGPIAFPVFGRGRVLYALVDRGITLDNVTTAAKFLIGSCSCQIKEQNPGSDLLVQADWKQLLHSDKLLDDPLPTAAEIMNRKPVLVPIPERKKK